MKRYSWQYILKIDENLDLLPANNFLVTFARWIYTSKTYLGDTLSFSGSPTLILNDLLDQVRDQYDFILIDTLPFAKVYHFGSTTFGNNIWVNGGNSFYDLKSIVINPARKIKKIFIGVYQ